MNTLKENRRYLPRNYAKSVSKALQINNITKVYKVAAGIITDFQIERELWLLINSAKKIENEIDELKNGG